MVAVVVAVLAVVGGGAGVGVPAPELVRDLILAMFVGAARELST